MKYIPLFYIKSILFLVAIFANNKIYGQQQLSLSGSIVKALENNFDIRISKKDVEIAGNNNRWGIAGRYPTVSLSVNQMNSFNDEKSQTGEGRNSYTRNSVSPDLNLRWILFDGFAVKIRKEKFDYLYQLAEENSSIIVENTIQAVILAYYKALLEKEKLAITRQLTELSGERYFYFQTKKELGSAVTYDVLQAKNAWLNDSSTYLLQSLNAENTLRNLNLLLGEEASVEYILTDEFDAQAKIYEYDALLDKMLKDNKTLKNQYINQELNQNEIATQKSALYPTVSLHAGTSPFFSGTKYSESPRINSDAYQFYSNFSLSYTLFNGGAIRNAIQNATVEQQIGYLELEEMKLKMTNTLFNTFEMYKIRKQLLNVAEESMETAKLNLDISTDKYKAGTINSFNYRDVQLIYLNAAFNRLQSIYDLIETDTELMRLTGGIIREYGE